MTITGNPSSDSGGKVSAPRNPLAESRGRVRMAKFRRENKLRDQHTYGVHYNDFFGECEFCRLALNYSLKHLSDQWFHDPDAIPGGFR